MNRSRTTRSGFAWLELLLALAAIALLLQLWPALGNVVLWSLDIRNWPRTVWFLANVVVIVVLVGIRFGPQLFEDWRLRRERLAKHRTTLQKGQEMKEQRETLERLKESQRRRIY